MSGKVVEHVLFFKAKEGTPEEKIEAWLSALRGLRSLEGVLHLTATPALRVRGGDYTHVLHIRFNSREALSQYSAHPRHVGVVQNYGKSIVEDVLALDWEVDSFGGTAASLVESYGALRIAFLKPRCDLGESEISEVAGILQGYAHRFPSIVQLSFGPNFSPGRAKGFEWGSLFLLPGLEELEELNANGEHAKLQCEKVEPKMEKYVVLDFCTAVGSPSIAISGGLV